METVLVNEDRTNWPIVIGIMAGVAGGIVAAIVLRSIRSSDDSGIRNAQDLIDRCRENIREIEAGLQQIRQPISL
jgi:hypothetical protein